jgi:CRISPR-associated protein Cmr6
MIPSVRHDIAALLNQGTMGQQGQNLSLYFSRLCKEIDEPDLREHVAKEFALKRLESGLSQQSFALYSRAYKNWREAWENNSHALCFEMSARTPLIIGMGDQNIHQFGITLQYPWGTPFIPGSAVKGVTSMYAQQSGDADWQRNLRNAEPDGQYAETVFGGINADRERTAGGIGFADAWWIPDTKRPFEADIINVHYRTYYQGAGNAWPDGTDAPLPVQFIAIKPGVRFLFVLTGDQNWCRVVQQIVRSAAEQRGFGAKTRVGYGRMQYVESVQELIARLDEMGSTELAGLYEAKKNDADYKFIFMEAVRRCHFSAELHDLFMKYRPAALFLKKLKEIKPKNLKDAKNIRDSIGLEKKQIDTSDADIQAVFNYCLPLAVNGIAGTWLEAFAYGFDDMVRGKNFDDTASVLIDHLDILKKRLANWPTIERINNDINVMTGMTDDQLMELKEIVDLYT